MEMVEKFVRGTRNMLQAVVGAMKTTSTPWKTSKQKAIKTTGEFAHPNPFTITINTVES